MYRDRETKQIAEHYAVWVLLSERAIEVQTPRKPDEALERQLVAIAVAGWQRAPLPRAYTQPERDVLRHLRRIGAIDAKDRAWLHPIEDWFHRQTAETERGQRIALELGGIVAPVRGWSPPPR